MTALTNIIRKELQELLTPSTVVPVVIMALVFGSIGGMVGNIQEAAAAKPIVGVVTEDTGVLANVSIQVFNASATLKYNGTVPVGSPRDEVNLSIDAALQAVDAKGGVAVIFIPWNFTANILGGVRGNMEIFWIMRGAGLLDSISSTAVDGLVARAGQAVSAYLIGSGATVPPDVVLAPMVKTDTTYFHNRVMAGISPSLLGNLLSSQSLMVPIIIMMIVIMAGSLVVSSMGMEKENKTLETLLTMPVRRSSIISGKLIASAIVGLLMAGIYMIGFSYYMSGLTGSSSINLAAYGLTVTPLDYVLLGLSVFSALLAALALCMVLGTFAKNYKAAQTLTMPITLLAMLPMFMTMFWDYNTLPPAAQVIVFAIPFSHPMMAMRSLMFKDYTLVLAGIAYSLGFAVVMILIAVWIFRTDRLLTGRFLRGGAGPTSRKGIWRLVNLGRR